MFNFAFLTANKDLIAVIIAAIYTSVTIFTTPFTFRDNFRVNRKIHSFIKNKAASLKIRIRKFTKQSCLSWIVPKPALGWVGSHAYLWKKL